MDSPFTDILHTNAVPSQRQCDDIRAFLTSPRQELANLDKELARLTSLLEEKIQKRARLRQFIDDHLALVSPMRWLPDEIFRAIFLETLPTTRNSAFTVSEGPLLLCRICQLWRSIALTTPRLWASMHIVVPSRAKFDGLMETVNTWLSRSGTVPLKISLVFSQTSDPHDLDLSQLFSIIASVSHRWQDILLTLPRIEDASAFSEVSALSVPSLLRVDLISHGANQSVFNHLQPLPLTFLDTPTLANFSFLGAYESLPSAINWSGLHTLTLTINAGNPVFLFSLVRHCQRLRGLEISLLGIEIHYPDAFEEFSLPVLSHFALASNGSTTSDGEILAHILLPKLDSLWLCSSIISNVDIVTLAGRAVNLRCMALLAEQVSSDHLVDALRASTALEDLYLDGEPYFSVFDHENGWELPPDPTFLMHLIASLPSDSTTPVLCPQLRRIALHGFVTAADTLIIQLVQSRTLAAAHANNVAHLSRAVFTLDRPKLLDFEAQLHDVVESGLVLEVSYDAGSQPAVFSPLEGMNGGLRAVPDYDYFERAVGTPFSRGVIWETD